MSSKSFQTGAIYLYFFFSSYDTINWKNFRKGKSLNLQVFLNAE